MTSKPVAHLAHPLFFILLVSAPTAAAAQTYAGGANYGTPYAAYRAGAGGWDDDRRALDGSYRDGTPFYRPGTWTGLYFGGHIGGGWGSFETSDLASKEIETSTLLGGVHAGYNLQMGSYVAGLEIDGTWNGDNGGTESDGALDVTANNDWLSSARVRLGYATDKMLVYATGGVALGDLDVSVDLGPISSSASETLVGYAVGGGIEYKLTDSWIARGEVIHYGFGEETFKSSLGSVDVDTDVTTVRAGLSLRLN